jgi:hypothetical protein
MKSFCSSRDSKKTNQYLRQVCHLFTKGTKDQYSNYVKKMLQISHRKRSKRPDSMSQKRGSRRVDGHVERWVTSFVIKTRQIRSAPVAHTYNPSYSGGRDQEDQGSKPARANSSQDPISKTLHRNRAGGVAQCKVPEFKPQCWKKKKRQIKLTWRYTLI